MHPTEPLQIARRAGPTIEADGWWSLSDPSLALVLSEVFAGRRRMVECGSGASTVLIARLMRELGRGHVWTLEHDAAWAALAATRLAAEGLGEHATVIEAPLAPSGGAPASPAWYDRRALDRLPAGGIDLLLIDGPPAGSPASERSRYPALPLLFDRLAEGVTVILDDADRPGERWALERWERELGFEPERRCEGLAVGSVAFRAKSNDRGEDSS